MQWEKIARLFDIEPEVIIEAAEIETAGKRKKVFPEDILIYEICETYPEWTRVRKLIPIICSLSKDEFGYIFELARSPLARMLLFKVRSDCDDKGAAAILQEYLYGNPLLREGEGTRIMQIGFIRYWIEEGGEERAIESLTIIGYSEVEAKEMVEKVKPAKITPTELQKPEEEEITPRPEVEKPKEDVLAEIKKRMERYKGK